MAPKKRSRRKVTSVVKTKKIIEETVEVLVSPGITNQGVDLKNQHAEILSSSTTQDETLEIFPPSNNKKRKKTIVIEEKDLQQQQHEEGTRVDEDETQPASEPTPRVDEKRRKLQGDMPKNMKTTSKGVDGEGGKKKRRKRGRIGGEGGGEGYKRYVYLVMKQVHPDMGISSKAMTILNNYMIDMFERIAFEAMNLSKYSKRVTLSSREIMGAVKLVLPGELGKHAIVEGTKAVTNYFNYVGSGNLKSRA
ncbi:hypothetical protein Leryth_009536 [Lithospermum erythrorhizon]|nr:hypothetical protein Leryth_009536 [Lithospermum erythrorhizon]